MALSADPLVSVVIPTWNRLPLLREAVASVQAQSYANWELVIADDGSSDGTAAWAEALGDPRIRHLALAHGGHLGAVRNRGVEAGKGELVAFLDSDDAWVPERLSLGVAALQGTGLRWGYGDAELMDECGAPAELRHGHHPRSGWIVERLLRSESGVAIGSLLVERALLREVGGFSEDPRLAFRGDLELALRLALRAETVAIPEVLVRIRQHPRRSTAALRDPHQRTARVFELFAELELSAELRELAAARRAYHLQQHERLALVEACGQP